VHFNHAGDALGLTGEGVEDDIAFFDGAGVDAGEGEGTELIIHDLEGQGAERFVGVGFSEEASLVAFGIHLGEGFDFERGGEVVHHGIEDELETFVFEGGAAIGREEGEIDGAFADAPLQGINVRLHAFEVFFHHSIILLDGGFDKSRAVFFGFIEHIGGDFLDFEVFWLSGLIPNVGFHGEEIDDTD
jgi:hypothetical protein